MSKAKENYIEYILKIEDELNLKEEINLIGFNLLRTAFFLNFVKYLKMKQFFKELMRKIVKYLLMVKN